jgi:hypothetical protein
MGYYELVWSNILYFAVEYCLPCVRIYVLVLEALYCREKVMKEQDLRQLLYLLDEYYKDKSKTCNYDCYNCELGILEGYCSGHSCAIETVSGMIDEELYQLRQNYQW